MSDKKLFISLRSLCHLVGDKSWAVEVTCQSHIFEGTIRDPFSEEDETKLNYHFTDYYRVDPFDKSSASVVADSLIRYATDLLNQIKAILSDANLDFDSRSCVLQVVTSQEEASIHRLHWETLEHPVLSTDFAVCRICLSESSAEISTSTDERVGPKLNLLFLTARKIGAAEVDVDNRPVLNSFLEVIAQLPQNAGVNFDVVRPATIYDLEQYLKVKDQGYYDLLHLDVHGRIGSTHEAELLLSSMENLEELKPITADHLGKLLKEHGVGSVFLNACDSARMDAYVESNLAASLLKAGIQNVIGMSYDLNVSAAEIFVREFYESFLIERLHMATATVRGRHALQKVKSRRARFKMNVDIEDWIIPVFYSAVEGSVFDNVSLIPPVTKDPKVPKASLLSIRDLPRIDLPLLGRDSDMLRLESCLLKHRCVEVNGPPGIGTTSLVKHAAAWWVRTKLIKSFSWHDMWDFRKAGEEDEDDDDEWWLTSLCTLLNSTEVLLVIDQMDYGDADNESIEEIDGFLTTFINRVSTSRTNYLIIITSTAPGPHEGFHTLTLGPLNEIHSMEVALQISPKLRSKTLINREDYYLFGRFLQSLLGNCLAITIFASYLEELTDFSIKHFVIAAWTTNLHKDHRSLLERIGQTRISISMRTFMTAVTVEDLPSLLTLAFCRERVSHDFISHLDEIDMIWNTRSEQSSRANTLGNEGSVSGVGLGQVEQSLRTSINRLQSLLLVTEDDKDKLWTLHPLLPYTIEAYLERNLWRVTRSMFIGVFVKRSFQWLTFPNDTEISRRFWESATVSANLDSERLNFIITAWIIVQDNFEHKIPFEPLFTSLQMFHPVGANIDLQTLATLASLFDDSINAQRNQPLYKRTVAYIGQFLASAISTRRRSQDMHESGRCSCQILAGVLEQMVWLTQYYGMYDYSGSLSLDLLEKMRTAIADMESIARRSNHIPISRTVFSTNQAKTQLAVHALLSSDFENARKLIENTSSKDITDPLLKELDEKDRTQTFALIKYSEAFASQDNSPEYVESTAMELEEISEDLFDTLARVSNVCGAEPFRASVDISGAVLRMRRNPADLYNINPVYASTLELRSMTKEQRTAVLEGSVPTAITRKGRLNALESFSGSSYLEAQFNSHLSLAKVNQESDIHNERSLFHLEEAMKILDNGKFLADTQRVGWLRLLIFKEAYKLGDSIKAGRYLYETYRMVSLPTTNIADVLLLAYTISNLYAVSATSPEILSDFSELELDIKVAAISWSSVIWDSQAFKLAEFEDPENAISVRSAYLDFRNGQVMWDARASTSLREGESDEVRSHRVQNLVLLLSSVVGCKPAEVESFLAKHFMTALTQAVRQDLASLGIKPGTGWAEYEDMTQSRVVCLEAEKILFAPASERKDFVWFDKKFEKKGLRTWWPKE